MNTKIFLVVCLLVLGLFGFWYYYKGFAGNDPRIPKQIVFIGDTKEHVLKMLGEPSIEFPDGGRLHQWYEGCEVTLSNDLVVAVEMLPIESEEERFERELRVQEDEKRLREAYNAALNQERISYAAWLDREEKRLEQERRELEQIKAYEKRRSEEKKAAIRAEAIRRCRRRYYH